VDVHRDAPPVVHHGHSAILTDSDFDAVADAGQSFVHGVVYYLEDQVMQPAHVGRADVHAGPAAHRLQTLQNLDVGRFVALGLLDLFFGHDGPTSRNPFSPRSRSIP
jgi:hypothetical protein